MCQAAAPQKGNNIGDPGHVQIGRPRATIAEGARSPYILTSAHPPFPHFCCLHYHNTHSKLTLHYHSIMSDIELLTLPSPTISPYHGLLVDNALSCPSLRCKTDHPHYYESPPILPYQYGPPIIYIRRFDPKANPYPKTNIWEVIGCAPDQLQVEQPVYVDGYGELTLSEIAVEDDDWRILTGCNATGTPVIVLAQTKKKEHEMESGSQTQGGFSFFFPLFSCCFA
jgi:hypothetical protein